MKKLNYNASGVIFTDEPHLNIGSGVLILAHDTFFGTDLAVRTAAAGAGTLLTLNVDYTIGGQDTRLTTLTGKTVYANISIINGAYQTGTLYFSGKYVGDYADAGDINNLLSGWIPFTMPLSYSSGTAFTYPADLTSTLQKGYGVKFTQNGIIKFFYDITAPSYAAPDSTVTVSPGNDSSGNIVTIEDTATYPITNAYWTPNPQAAFGFPIFFNYAPTWGGNGGMTYTSITGLIAKFKIIGDMIKVFLRAEGITGGAAGTGITATYPIAPNDTTNINYASGAGLTDGGGSTYIAGVMLVTTTFIFKRYDGALWGLGTERRVTGDTEYLY